MEMSCIKKKLIQLGSFRLIFCFWARCKHVKSLLEGMCFSISSVELNFQSM